MSALAQTSTRVAAARLSPPWLRRPPLPVLGNWSGGLPAAACCWAFTDVGAPLRAGCAGAEEVLGTGALTRGGTARWAATSSDVLGIGAFCGGFAAGGAA